LLAVPARARPVLAVPGHIDPGVATLRVTLRLANPIQRSPAIGAGLDTALMQNLGAAYGPYAATHKRLVPFVW